MSEFEAYRGLFVAESRENHENMVKNLLILEKGSNQDAIDEIFRSIHTLKGASASMGFADMERLCHAMEDIFQLIRSGSAEMSQDLGNLLLACSDMLEQMIDDVEGGGDSSSINPDDQVHSLKEWLEKLGGGTTKDAKKAAPSNHVPAVQPDAVPSSATDSNGAPEFDIRIIVSPDCMMKDVRAMIAIGNLEALGTITRITPSKDDIDEGRFDGTVDLRITSEAGEEALLTAAQGSEIATVEIKPVQAIKQEKNLAEQDKKQQASAAEKSREIKNLRVDIQALDHIMNLVEDLVINRGRLKQIAEQHRIKEMDEAIGMVDRSVLELQNLMMNIRMIPLNHIFNRLPRVVRDVAQYDSKEVEFVIEGGETELDRSVMDGL
ncbi:Hpt domain-containing protein, partial [Methanoregula sp.]|uniref:Hpt domain-containing protein n=1 Tax=Methanoregula sp. TaxID=2052170 RepID=UPI000CBB7889